MRQHPRVLNCQAMLTDIDLNDVVYIGGATDGVPSDIAARASPQFTTPFRDTNRARARALYEKMLGEHPRLAQSARQHLRGKHLACWCAPAPCHGDVLLKVANQRPRSAPQLGLHEHPLARRPVGRHLYD
jgi:hypothetical protein